MKNMIKSCLALCFCLLCVFLSVSAGAARPRTRVVSIPSFAVRSEQISLFAGENHTFYLLSSDDQSGTLLSLFDAQSAQFTVLFSDPLPYTAAVANQDVLLIASSTMQFDPQEQDFVRFTRIIRYFFQTGTQETLTLSNLYLSSDQCLALDQKGLFYTADSEEPDVLRIYGPQGTLQDSLPCKGGISSLSISPSGEELFLTDLKSNRLSKLDLSTSGAPQMMDTPAPVLPYRFLSDTEYVDGLGDVYDRSSSDEFRLAYSTLSPQPPACMYDQRVLCIPAGGPLLQLDSSTGEALAQHDIPQGALDLAVSGETAAILFPDSSGYRLGCVNLTTPEELEPISYSPAYGPLGSSQITELWEHSLPENRSIQEVYSLPADLEGFEYPSSLSPQVLADGLNAVNFHRSLSGLPPVELDQEGCGDLSFGAVLALFADGPQIPGKPEGMSDSFYRAAVNAYHDGQGSIQEALTPYPLTQAVHEWMKTDPIVRDFLLSPGLTHLSFGAATGSDGSTSVLVAGMPETSDAITSFPPGGACPSAIANSGPWSLRLGDGLLAGVRGHPRVVITHRESGESTLYTVDSGLSYENGFLVWNFVPSDPSGFYFVQIENLCTADGLPATVSYEVSLFELDLSLPPADEDPIPPPVEGGIQSDLYRIDRGKGIIYGISPATSGSAFRRNLIGEGTIELRKNGRPVTSGSAGTGMKAVLLRNEQVVDELTLLVYGDVTGEGNVNTLDLRALYKHLLEQQTLAEPFSWAADLNRDGQVNTLDLLAADKFLAGSYDIPQN